MNRLKFVPVSILFALILCPGGSLLLARGDALQKTHVVLEDLIAEALSVNPRVMAAENQWRAARKKYAAGSAAQQDALKAQLEISKLTDRLLTLRQGRSSAAAKLNALLNRAPDSDLGPVREAALPVLDTDAESLLARALEGRPATASRWGTSST